MELNQLLDILGTIKAHPANGLVQFSASESDGGFKIKATISQPKGDVTQVFAVSKGYWIPKTMGWNDIVIQAWKILNDTMIQHMKETFFVEGKAIWTYHKPSPREILDQMSNS